MTVCQSACLDGKYPPIVNDIDLKEEDLWMEKKGIGPYSLYKMQGKKHTQQLSCNNYEYFSPTQQPRSEVEVF